MPRTGALLLLCATTAVAAAASQQTRVKVFVLAGQSNMEGQAEVEMKWPNGTEKNGTLTYQTTDPRTAAAFAQTLDPQNSSAWRVRDDVWVWFNEVGKTDDGTWGNLSTRFGCEGSAANHIGPEYGFGFKMADALGEQILIIKTAWGGKTLAGDLRPPSSCADPATSRNRTVGYFYSRMLAMVEQTLSPANLTRYFPGAAAYEGFDIVGFGWDQGWNDGCGTADAEEYEFNMVNVRMKESLARPRRAPFSCARPPRAAWYQPITLHLLTSSCARMRARTHLLAASSLSTICASRGATRRSPCPSPSRASAAGASPSIGASRSSPRSSPPPTPRSTLS